MHEDVWITLEREEEAQRIPVRDEVCALLWASPLAAEHFKPENVAALFSAFGDVLEVDPTCFLGSDMSCVKAVICCERARLVPCDVWPKKGPWGTRIVEVEVIEVWPAERFYIDGVYQRFFAPPTPPLFRGHHALIGRPVFAAPAASPRVAGVGVQAVDGWGNQLLLAAAPPPSPASAATASVTHSSAFSTELWGSSAWSSITSAGSHACASGVVITELEVGSPLAPVARNAGVGNEELEEENWAAVIDSAHHRRKARGKEKRAKEAVRKSSRLAGIEPDAHVDMLTKAVKFRELKEALKGCSARLQKHVAKSKVMQKLVSPLGMKFVSALKVAAFGKDDLVPAGSDD
jgi:hypothetical protein